MGARGVRRTEDDNLAGAGHGQTRGEDGDAAARADGVSLRAMPAGWRDGDAHEKVLPKRRGVEIMTSEEQRAQS